MATITIPDMDPVVVELLREHATRNGRSLNDEAVAILTDAVKDVSEFSEHPECRPARE